MKGLDSPAAVDVDGKERVYIGDVAGQRLVRTNAEGGRLYVACANDGGFSKHLMLMFQPF